MCSIYPPINLSVHPSTHQSFYLFIHCSVPLVIHPSIINPSTHPSIHHWYINSVGLSIPPSVHPECFLRQVRILSAVSWSFLGNVATAFFLECTRLFRGQMGWTFPQATAVSTASSLSTVTRPADLSDRDHGGVPMAQPQLPPLFFLSSRRRTRTFTYDCVDKR